MPTANVRYGRPKGSGLDDRQQLETLAALLAANPQLKPTTAIRSLGVEDPSTIRRLRDKLRNEQATLTAEAWRGARVRTRPATSNENPPAPVSLSALPITQSRALVRVAPQTSEIAPMTPAAALVGGWCDLTFSMLAVAAEAQASIMQHWLAQPSVAAAARRQLALGSVAVAVYTRCTRRRRIFH
jgi:hypothetical protein